MPSKRTITTAMIEHLRSKLLAPTYEEAGEKLVALFGTEGHAVFTRKDWDLVLEATAAWTATFEVPSEVKIANAVFAKVSKGLNRPSWGHYAAPGATPAAPAAPVASEPTPEAPEAPPVASETPDLDELLDQMTGQLADIEAKDEALQATMEAVAPVTPPAPAAPAQKGVAWVPEHPTATSHPIYVEDEGLRRLAVSQSRCFGHFSDRAPSCKGCPLASFCAMASMSVIADIEAALNRETEEALQRIKDREEEKNLFNLDVTSKDTDPDLFDVKPTDPDLFNVGPVPAPVPLGPGMTRLNPPFDSICTTCKQKIPAGSSAVHVSGKGVMHTSCVGAA